MLFSFEHSNAQLPAGLYANNVSLTAGQHFSARHLYDKKNWNAEWIWLNQNLFQNYQRTQTEWIHPFAQKQAPYRALFRKQFTIDKLPEKAVLFISADVRYEVYINDTLAGEGPVNIGSDYGDTTKPAYWYYGSFDVRKHCRRGINTIAVVVYGWGLEISETTCSYGRMICELQSEKQTMATSDASWKAIADTSYNVSAAGLQFNAIAVPKGWTSSRLNESAWPSVSVIGAANAVILLRDNIPSLRKELVHAVHVYKTDSSWLQDYGKNIVGHIAFDVQAAAGDTLTVIPFEKSIQQPNRVVRFICNAGNNKYYSPFIAPFRFLMFKKTARTKIKTLDAIFTTYPVEYSGSFSCSNTFYNELWAICRYTTQLCMSNMFFDSPAHQEPIGCTGDYLIESMNNYYCFGDPWLTRQNLLQTAQLLQKNDMRMFHTSYSLLWVQMLRQYARYSGDQDLVRQLLPVADKLMSRFIGYLGTDSLVNNAPNYMFMDWITIRGFNAHHPPAVIGSGYMSALLYKAMNDIDAMRGSTPLYDPIAENIKSAVNRLLWDREKHLYKDGIPFTTNIAPGEWMPADTAIVTHSAHVNTMAVLYGIAPASEQNQIINWVSAQQEYELQPYFMSYVLAACEKTGMADKGLGLINRWKGGIDTVTKTMKENWRDKTDFGYGGDYSHAWGGAPLRFLSSNILGISPGVTGYDTICVRPYTGNLITHAKGAVPVGNNDCIEVAWQKSNRSYTLVCSVPAGRTTFFYYPDGRMLQLKSGKNKVVLPL